MSPGVCDHEPRTTAVVGQSSRAIPAVDAVALTDVLRSLAWLSTVVEPAALQVPKQAPQQAPSV